MAGGPSQNIWHNQGWFINVSYNGSHWFNHPRWNRFLKKLMGTEILMECLYDADA